MSRKILSFLLILSILISLTISKKTKTKKTGSRKISFIQQGKEEGTIDASCFLSGPASSESSGCFLSTPSGLQDQVQKKIGDLTSTCGAVFENKEVSSALSAAKELGKLQERIISGEKIQSNEVDDLRDVLVKDFNVNRNTLENVDSKFIHYGYEGINNVIKAYCKKENVPQFLENKYLNYLKLNLLDSYLDSFPQEEKKECLAVNKENTDAFEFAYSDINNDLDPLKTQEFGQTIKLEPSGFEKGGYAVAYWVLAEPEKLKDDPQKYAQGYSDNKKVFEYREEPCRTSHITDIGNQQMEINVVSKCAEYELIILLFQKVCTGYKCQLHSLNSYVNAHYDASTNELTPDLIEKLDIKISDKAINPKLYIDFTATEENINRLVADMLPSMYNHITELIDVCDNGVEHCEYTNKDGDCLICEKGYNYVDGICRIGCPDGTYQLDNNTCGVCDEKCKNCEGPGKCTECEEGTNYYEGMCYEKCPDGTFPVDGECQKCGEDCVYCSNSTYCGKCAKGTYFNDGKCVTECPVGTYLDIVNMVCDKCKTGCESCSSYEICKTCEDDYYMYEENKCVKECPDTFRKNDNTKKCEKCNDNCKKCTESSDQCDECEDGYSLLKDKTCGGCPNGQVSFKKVCIDCEDPDKCVKCNPSNIRECLKCKDGLYLQPNKTCHATCDPGYYVNEQNECVKCATENCDKCDNKECQECADGYYLFENSKCPKECPDGYVSIGKQCVQCSDKKCVKCSENDLSVCTKCDYPKEILKEGKCVQDCGEGYVAEGQECVPCIAGCKDCDNKVVCVVCDDSHYFLNGKCVTDCGSGKSPNQNTGVCEDCLTSNCDSCPDKEVCLDCKEGYVLYNNICYERCPVGTFLSADQRHCESCDPKCAECTNKKTCTRCKIPYFLQGEVCQEQCNNGYYDNDRVCEECQNTKCEKCSKEDSTICTKCPPGSLFYKGNCVTLCPEDTYEGPEECLPCSPNCRTCKHTSDNCESCPPGLKLSDNECKQECPEKTTEVDGKCVPCSDPRCLVCKPGNPDYCTTPGGSVFIDCDDDETICTPVDECEEKQYADVNRRCRDCKEHCAKCTDGKTCDKCEGGFYLKDDECVSDCGSGYVESEEGLCIQCKNSCEKCKVDDSQCCTSCPFKTFQLNCDCVSSCGDKYWENVEERKCVPCDDPNCQKCSNDGKTCEECSNGFVLDVNGEKCIPKPCPAGSSAFKGKCMKCLVDGCESCPYATDHCVLCDKSKVLVDEFRCDSNCPDRTVKVEFEDKPGYSYCEKCMDPHCITCSDTETCVECEVGTFLLEDKCVNACPDGYREEDGKCIKCGIENCKKCNSKDECIDCMKDLLRRLDGECGSQCEKGSYEKDGKCVKCPDLAVECDANTIFKCESPYIVSKDGKSCVDKCPSGSVEINGQCTMCKTDENCDQCEKDLITCRECKGDYVLQDNNCKTHCGDGYYVENKKCKKCMDNCYKCTDDKTCKECNSPYVINNDECVLECPSGYYKGDKKCKDCIEGCETCDNGETCKVCEEGYLLENGVCVKVCSNGYYKFSEKECRQCDENCLSCEGPKQCKLCQDPYLIYKGECVKSCPQGMTAVNKNCVLCGEHCTKCSEPGKCTGCESEYGLFNGQCVKPCPTTYFNDEGTCSPCIEHCDLCTENFKVYPKQQGQEQLRSCEKCTNGYYYSEDSDECVSNCPTGQSPFDGECVKCQADNCKACVNEVTSCSSCPSGMYLYKGDCVTPCPTKTYVDGDSCSDCAGDCQTCENPNECKSCPTGLILNDGRCTSECDDGEAPVNGKCEKCLVSDCKSCNPVDLNECFICEENMYLSPESKCVSDCPQGYYADKDSGKCVECSGEHCATCPDGEKCTKCEDGYVIQNGVCKLTCDSHYVERHGECVECTDKNCAVCDNMNLDTCKRCEKPFALINNKCVSSCPTGTFTVDLINGFVCQTCPENCASCVNSDECTSCKNPLYLKDGKCVPNCGNYYVGTDGICKKCSQSTCVRCSESDTVQCFECEDKQYLNDAHECVSNCGDGYYASNGKCVPCGVDKCSQCKEQNKCEKCAEGSVLYKGKCIEFCVVGTYEKDRECLPCDDSDKCKRCYPLSPNKCKECQIGYLNDTQCVDNCPEGTYQDELTKTCKKCSTGCKNCKDDNTCYNCEEGLFLDSVDKTCNDKCKSYQVAVNGVCKDCTQKYCISCQPDDLSKCVQCNPEMYNYNGLCVSECPEGTFEKGNDCVDCESNCKRCTDESTCTECIDGKVEYNYDCYDECTSNYVNVNGHCKKCIDDKCLVCDPNDLGKCLTCEPDHLNDAGKCVKSCGPSKYYNDDTQRCEDCLEGCEKCTNPKTCQRCVEPLLLDEENTVCTYFCRETFFAAKKEEPPHCEKCENPNCKACCPSIPIHCLQCPEGWFLFTEESGLNDCVKPCPSGYIGNTATNKCQKCEEGCAACKETPETCTSCESGFKMISNNRCVPIVDCPEGTVEREGVCLKCQDSYCLKCDSLNVNKCLLCDDVHILYNDECLPSCPKGMYEVEIGGTRTCKKCDSTCESCSNAESCDKCAENYNFIEGTKTCTICQPPSMIIGEECVSCKAEGCAVCVEGQPEKCRICDDKLVLFGQECYSDCPKGFYKENGKCLSCDVNCETCSNIDQCTKCVDGTFLYQGKCVTVCPDGTVGIDGVCNKCAQDDCIKCPTAVDVCTECKTILYNGKCIDSCPDGTVQYGKACVKCSENCLKCDLTQCLKCTKGLYLKENICVEDCGDGFHTKDDRVCVECSTKNCEQCGDDDVCKVCKTGFYLNENNECINPCPSGTFGDDETGTCEKCPVGCTYCKSQTECIKCNDGYSFYEGVCTKPCPAKTTSVVQQCVPCDQALCAECAPGDPKNCVKCENYIYNGVCHEECPEGTYVNTLTKECIECDPKCKKCDSEKCLECKSEFIMDDGECTNKCGEGKANVNGICEACEESGCKVCSSNLKTCYECNKPAVLYEGKCVSSCPTGYYLDTTTNSCDKCDYSCDTCTSKDKCILCRAGYYKLDSSCLTSCPEGMYEDCKETARTCENCDVSCKTCVLGTNSDCIECATGYVMYNRKCIKNDNCPTGTYYDSTASTCQKCKVSYCEVCADAEVCKTCKKGFKLNSQGVCEETHTLTNIIEDFDLVSKENSADPVLKSGAVKKFSDYQGTGVGSNEVTFTFYFRSLSPNLKNNLDILSVINEMKSAYNYKFYVDANDKKCKVSVYGNDENKPEANIEIASCIYENIYDWKFVSLTLSKTDSGNFKVTVNSRIVDKEEKAIEVPTGNYYNIIEPSAYILLGKNGVSNYNIGKLNIMDYAPSDDDINRLIRYLPSDCDYFCTECKDTCRSCPDGIIPISNRCNAQSLKEAPELNTQNTPVEFNFKDNFDNKLASNAYGFTEWIYLKGKDSNKENIMSAEVNGVPYVNLTISNGEISYNNVPIQHNTLQVGEWYYIIVSMLKDNVNITIKDRQGKRYSEIIKDQPFIRHYKDFKYNLHSYNSKQIGGTMKARVYVNNVPTDDIMRGDEKAIQCSDNCLKCNTALKCTACSDGFKLTTNGLCEELSAGPDDYTLLDNVFDIYNKDEKTYSVPYDENLTITFNLRKKTHSNMYQENNNFNILSYKSSKDGEKKSLIKETIPSDFKSVYTVFDDKNQFSHDYTDELPDFLVFVVTLNKFKEELDATVTDFGADKTYSYKLKFPKNDEIKYLVFGDSKGIELNYQFGNVKVYDGLAKGDLLASLNKKPQQVGAICMKYNWENGLCYQCNYEVKETADPHECKSRGYSWQPASLFGYNDWSELKPATFTNKFIQTDSIGMNGDYGIMYFRFKMANLNEGARYRVACFSNDKIKTFVPTNYRGDLTVCVQVFVKNNLGNVEFLLNDFGPVTVSTKGFTFKPKEYVRGLVGLNAAEKLFQYSLRHGTDVSNAVQGEYNYQHYPERFQPSGALSLWGIEDTGFDKKLHSVPHIFMDVIKVHPNVKYADTLYNSFEGTYYPKEPICKDGCDTCVWDPSNYPPTSTKCYECVNGYNQEKVSQNDDEVKCTKANILYNFYKGRIYQGDIDLPITKPEILDDSFAIYLQLQFNFPYYDTEGYYKFLELGTLRLIRKGNSVVLTVGNSDSVEVPLYDPYNTWNNVFMVFSGTQVTVSTHAGTFVKTNSMKTAGISGIKGNKIAVSSIGYSTSITNVILTNGDDYNTVKQPEPTGYDTCGPDCEYCENGVCKVCGSGFEETDSNSCQNGKILFTPKFGTPGEDNLLNRFEVFPKTQRDKFIRISKWTFTVLMEYNSLPKGSFTFFRAYDYDGVYSIEGNINFNNGKITFYVILAENPTQSYTLSLSLPSAPVSPIIYLALSYKDKALSILVAETKSNFVAQEYKLPSILGYFGQQFGFDINSPIASKMTNVVFYKHQAKTLNDLKSEIPFRTRKIQEACLLGSSALCTKCSSGKLENGLCIPPSTSAVKMLLFAEYLQFNEHINPTSTAVTIPNTYGFTVSFVFRMASVLKRIDNILKITKGNSDYFAMRYNTMNDRFTLQFGNKIYTSGNVFRKANTPYQFFKVSVQCDIYKGTFIFKVKYIDGTTLVEESSNMNAGYSYLPQGQYNVVVGYNTNTPQGQFEIGGVEFFDRYLSTKELELYEYNGIQECQNACYKVTQGVCTVDYVNEDTSIGLDSYGKYSQAPLFYGLTAFYPIDRYYSFNHYIVSFTLNITDYNRQRYSANPSVLFAFTDDGQSVLPNLDITATIPESILENAFTMSLVGTVLELKLPTKTWSTADKRTVKYFNIGSTALTSDLTLNLYVDATKNAIKGVLTYKGSAFEFDLDLNDDQQVMPLGWNTLAYAHPALSTFVVTFDKNMDSIFYDGLNPETSLNCISTSDNEKYCPNCAAKFRPYDAGCNTVLYDHL
jgi:hypothetical protein